MQQSRRMVFGRYDYASFLVSIAYSAGVVVMPVSLVSLARDLGFGLESGGLAVGGALHLGRTLAMVASLLLCGFWAGRWGKRRTLSVSVLLMGLGMGLCAFAPTYRFVFLALIVAGVGEGIIEGLSTPFVQDLHPEESGRYINFSHAFWSIGVVATTLLAGALLSRGVSWRWITGVVAALALTRRFCQLMGGDVSVTSIAGESSTFVLKVPAMVSALGPLKIEAAVLANLPLTVTKDIGADIEALPLIDNSVQVIDDEAIQRDLSRRFLNGAGFTV